MKVFTGRYSWDGKKHDGREPIAWFPGAYNLKIFHLGGDDRTVQHLKPFLCIYSKTGEGHSISANPEKFAKHICTEFNLDLEKVLWAEEQHEDSGEFEVIVFTRDRNMGGEVFYKVEKREPLAGEKNLIENQLALLA